MSGVVDNIRAKIKRRFSHKDKEMNFDEADSADEETNDYVNKEYTAAENDDTNPHGKPGSLLNKMILHGNKKTEDQLFSEQALMTKKQEEDLALRQQAEPVRTQGQVGTTQGAQVS